MDSPWYQTFIQGKVGSDKDYHAEYRRAFRKYSNSFNDPEDAFQECLVRLCFEKLPTSKKGEGLPLEEQEAIVMTAFLNTVIDRIRSENGRPRAAKYMHDFGEQLGFERKAVQEIYELNYREIAVEEIVDQSRYSPESVRELVKFMKANPLGPLRLKRTSLEMPGSDRLRPEVESGLDGPDNDLSDEIAAEEETAILAALSKPPGVDSQPLRYLGPAASAKVKQMRIELAFDELDYALLKNVQDRSPSISVIARLFGETVKTVRDRKAALIPHIAKVFEAHGFGTEGPVADKTYDSVPEPVC